MVWNSGGSTGPCWRRSSAGPHWPGATRQESLERLKRLKSRPQFISHEKSQELKNTRAYLAKNMPNGNFTFLQMSFRDHTDRWVLRDIPERRAVRAWFRKALSPEEKEGR